MAKALPRSIEILGRRWFQKTFGNTYHSVMIVVDGKPVHKVPYEYGYGEQYLFTAFEWLAKNGIIPALKRNKSGGVEQPWRWAQENGVKLTHEAIDVKRKADL